MLENFKQQAISFVEIFQNGSIFKNGSSLLSIRIPSDQIVIDGRKLSMRLCGIFKSLNLKCRCAHSLCNSVTTMSSRDFQSC